MLVLSVQRSMGAPGVEAKWKQTTRIHVPCAALFPLRLNSDSDWTTLTNYSRNAVRRYLHLACIVIQGECVRARARIEVERT